MSTVKGIDRTKLTATAPSSTDNLLAQGKQRGKLRHYEDEYEAAALQIDDIIQVCKTIPKGAIIVGIELDFDSLGGGTTLDVGDSDDDDRYMSAIDASAGVGSKTLNLAGMNYVIGTNDGDTIITITLEGAAATGTIKISVTTSEE